jgi:hypothetical protein
VLSSYGSTAFNLYNPTVWPLLTGQDPSLYQPNHNKSSQSQPQPHHAALVPSLHGGGGGGGDHTSESRKLSLHGQFDDGRRAQLRMEQHSRAAQQQQHGGVAMPHNAIQPLPPAGGGRGGGGGGGGDGGDYNNNHYYEGVVPPAAAHAPPPASSSNCAFPSGGSFSGGAGAGAPPPPSVHDFLDERDPAGDRAYTARYVGGGGGLVVGADTATVHHAMRTGRGGGVRAAGRVGYHFSLTLFCSQNTVQLMTASVVRVTNLSDTARDNPFQFILHCSNYRAIDDGQYGP